MKESAFTYVNIRRAVPAARRILKNISVVDPAGIFRGDLGLICGSILGASVFLEQLLREAKPAKSDVQAAMLRDLVTLLFGGVAATDQGVVEQIDNILRSDSTTPTEEGR